MIKIHAPSTTVRVGDIVQLPLTCSEPGDVVITSSNEAVAVVSSPVTIQGTRTWRNGLKHGQYLARANCLQARDNVTICIEYDERKIGEPNTDANVESQVSLILRNHRIDAVQRINWAIGLWMFRVATNSVIVRPGYFQSATNASAQIAYYCITNTTHTVAGIRRFLVFLSGDKTYWCNNGTGTAYDQTVNRTAPVGTMGGTEIISIHRECKACIFPGEMSQAQREAFCQSGTFPAGATAQWLGGHEIDPTTPVFWDTSGNNYDLYDYDMIYTGSYEASASGDYADDPLNPVVPYSVINISPLAAGTTTITTRRRRQGVPDRASDGEKYEEDTYLLTVADALVAEQATVQLMIYASIAGTATIAMDNPIIDFPASVAVVEGKNQISGAVLGAGTCNVTVTLDGQSSVTQFIVDEITTVIAAGPPQTIRARL